DKNIINITTTNNIKGFFNIIENKILLYYPVLLHEKNTKDFIETEQMSALAYTRIVQDETFYSLLHELRHAYNSQLIQKFSENKGISYTDLFEFAFFDEFSAEFSSMCARINNHYLYGYNFLFEGNSLCKNINKILCNNNNNKDEIFQKIKTYLYNYIKNGQKNQNYDTLYFLQTVKTYMNILQSKNLAKNQISEENFNSLKSKMLTFDLYNPQTKKLDSIDFSKYTEGFVKYNKNSIHEILGDLYKNYCK
ncbi:MAG: hypothetical protein IJ638_03410, partial [Alphaproteobacteria bacterium]|nr:hypothetical protein [Alphaproteobacteria bacterium]